MFIIFFYFGGSAERKTRWEVKRTGLINRRSACRTATNYRCAPMRMVVVVAGRGPVRAGSSWLATVGWGPIDSASIPSEHGE